MLKKIFTSLVAISPGVGQFVMSLKSLDCNISKREAMLRIQKESYKSFLPQQLPYNTETPKKSHI